jgi:LCP family protein required for cell wall assembly
MLRKLIKFAGCLTGGACIVLIIVGVVYYLFPGRQNILILGIDAREEEGNLGRTDTMIVTTFDPIQPYVGVLSIPRDLWVNIPGYGENRINTAHFFAESQATGTGPYAAINVVEYNFDIDVDYFARLRFDSLIELVNMMDGLDVNLEIPMSGYTSGEHHLDSEQVLAFARDRSGSDDFYRMERGQLILRALMSKLSKPMNWRFLPEVLKLLYSSVDTNVPLLVYPRLAIALIRTNPENIDFKLISREMVLPFTTEGGAAVLAPNWEMINPLINDIFGQ